MAEKLPKLDKKSLENLRDRSLLKKEDGSFEHNIKLSKAASIIATEFGHVISNDEMLFVSHYCNPLSDGYRDYLYSAKMSGISEEDAQKMVASKWWQGLESVISEIFRLMSEKRIFEIMMMDPRETVTTTRYSAKNGTETTTVNERINPALLRIIADMAKFSAVAKGKGDWNPKLTLEHEVGPKTIGELLAHLSNDQRKNSESGSIIDGDFA